MTAASNGAMEYSFACLLAPVLWHPICRVLWSLAVKRMNQIISCNSKFGKSIRKKAYFIPAILLDESMNRERTTEFNANNARMFFFLHSRLMLSTTMSYHHYHYRSVVANHHHHTKMNDPEPGPKFFISLFPFG